MKKSIHLEEIPYCRDSCDLFELIADLPHAALFDSSHPHSLAGRYDILVAAPAEELLPQLSEGASEAQTASFFSAMADYHREAYADIQPASQDISFCGGILGYLSYDVGNALHGIADIAAAPLPAQHLHAYDWCVIQDHLLGRAVLVSLPRLPTQTLADIRARLRSRVSHGAGLGCLPAQTPFTLQRPFTSNVSSQEYEEAFCAIQAYIQAGDCYQVNLTQQFSAPYSGSPWLAYRLLRGVAAAPFSAYLALDNNAAIMSLSPERFLSLHGHRVETSPIKGTRARNKDWRLDQQAARELRDSQKDRAENLMIVDLLRNDLGRSCVPGSIHVDRLFEVQSFPTVHHLVSTISGELQAGRNAWDLLRDSFPGGSITGAPKRRAMEIIAELENHERRIYCGSMLYVSADGRMDSNIAIRTLWCDSTQVRCWGGGGIVADSQCELEYQETFDKVDKLLKALENL